MLQPVITKDAADAKENPASEREFLRKMMKQDGICDAAKVIGSREKLSQVVNGKADVMELLNQGRPEGYRLGRAGDAAARMAGMRSEELSLLAGDMTPPVLSKAGQMGRDYVVSNGISTGHEYGAAVRGMEVIDRFTSSSRNILAVPRYLSSGDGNVEIHHNHPSGDSLSVKDFAVLLFRPELGAVSVHGHAGFYTRAVKLGQSASLESDAWAVSELARVRAAMLTRNAYESGILSAKQVNSGLWQVVMGLLFEDDGRIIFNINSQSLRDIARTVIDHGK